MRSPNKTLWFVASVGLAWSFAPRPAHAWSIGSQLNKHGCHEPITAEALRRARAALPTAPMITPTRDEAAFIADVVFEPPADFVGDLAGMALLLGVRDNDLKGIDPLDSLELIQVHGNPATQEEHCIRRLVDDGAGGDQGALTACRGFIREQATAALDGLTAAGFVDPSNRKPLEFYVQIAGDIAPPLPIFYIKMGAAMHALEDGFTHVYRSPDGRNVTTVLNWIDFTKQPYDESRDGPPHLPALDDCRNVADPIIERNVGLATDAATELLMVALDPTLSRAQKIAGFDTVTAKYLTFSPGCSMANNWCNPADATVKSNVGLEGCSAGGDAPWGAMVLVGGALLCARRRRSVATGVVGLLAAGGLATSADAKPIKRAAPTKVTVAAATEEQDKIDRVAEQPTAAGDVSTWAFTGSVGGAIERTAAVGTIGVRYRINDSWLVGADVAWNPWLATSPVSAKPGVAAYYATLIRRFPMRSDLVNLRSSVHLGASTLLFDVYGAPKYSTGLYGAISLLGIDIDVGHTVRLVIDPAEFALPVPHLGQIPLWYQQFRTMVGVQVGF